ncbi:galactitol-1-phosphate 5-dehydrogenase [Paenibacillus thalictri]|uniref:Galactitol-1-phosphate 5-dehydrogenase n=2 Tax=Paenibacillus thalictri TaxID=2527873 RepID=A0A4Q9DL88_9BACL|nr:galactitol-1-phosphate 5-dehydrogenase [Paenibacillus thalictri]
MKAAVLYAKNDIRIEETAIPPLHSHEILVKVMATGICGSDLPRVMGDAAHHYPIVLGHEFSGIVEAVGDGVTRIKTGDRVAGIPLKPCFACHDCRSGNFAQCQHYSFIGSRINGSWAEYVAIPEINAIPFDANISFEEAALVEPSTVALHALKLIQFQGGEHVAVLGGGNIGLLALQWSHILGAKTVTVFDIDDARLEKAKLLGADYTVNPNKAGADDLWRQITSGKGFGVVLEAAGSDVTIKQSFELAASKAKVCLIGTPSRDFSFSHKQFELMNRKEFTLTGSWMSYGSPFPGHEWALSLHFLKQKRLNFLDMIDRSLALADINEAFDLYRKPGAAKGKILLYNS